MLLSPLLKGADLRRKRRNTMRCSTDQAHRHTKEKNGISVDDQHKHSITGWQVTLSAFLLLVPELFEKSKFVLFSRFNQYALENYFSQVRRMTILLQWTSCTRTRMLLAELMFAMCRNANYEPDDDIILESTQIIPQTDEDCLDLVVDEPSWIAQKHRKIGIIWSSTVPLMRQATFQKYLFRISTVNSANQIYASNAATATYILLSFKEFANSRAGLQYPSQLFRQTISDEVKKNSNLLRKCKREGKLEEIETALLEWFKIARERKIPISRPILFQKAQDFTNLFGYSDFKATDGWLARWKDRSNIVYRKLHGEKQVADSAAAEDWRKDVWPTLVKDYKPDQIFNTDETGLFFRALPEHTLLFKKESPGGCKNVKKGLTCC
ncbi:Tigger transposable element-derived protein 4 [Araneus ventricosus]|uniref:Tigger transposable element-derived protein 4 n=1 Tax=Araneus ventricosus TaxID=182803 RepID=A0A4Y2RXS7_ARAVE|nr:Tigger transposable element-derived protein 4 [Araneus ventricosus]